MRNLWISFLLFVISNGIQAEESQSWIDRYELYAEQARKAWDIPGMALAVVKDNKIIYAKGFGVRKRGENAFVDPHTIFQIGSISKSFTTTLMASLIDQHLIKWEDPVYTHAPEFVLSDPWVTRQFMIEDLFAQRSGLPTEIGTSQAMLGYSTDEIVQHLRQVKLVSPFRASYAYQNIFFDLSAKLMKNVSGKSWVDLLKKRILTPLQMEETSATLTDFLNSPNRAAWYHRSLTGEIEFLPEDFPYANWVYEEAPAGGINSNVLDLSKWLMLHMYNGLFNGQQLISQENMNKLHRPQIYVGTAVGYDHFYALGWAYTMYHPHPLIWHTGGTRGAGTIVAFDPEEKLGFVLLTNVAGTDFTLPLMLTFFDFYYGRTQEDFSALSLTSKREEEERMKKALIPPAQSWPALPLDKYAGTYTNSIYGSIEVKPNKDQLTLIIGPKSTQMHLIHWDRDVFRLDWPYMNDEISFVHFRFNQLGKPSDLYMEIFKESDPHFHFQSPDEQKL